MINISIANKTFHIPEQMGYVAGQNKIIFMNQFYSVSFLIAEIIGDKVIFNHNQKGFQIKIEEMSQNEYIISSTELE